MAMQRALFVSLLAAVFALAAIPAHADRDAVQFGSNIDVTDANPVHDAVCFFCSVRVDGKVSGDIVVFFGDIHLAGEAHHDVVNFFGSITAADNSSIGGDMVSFVGSVRLGENVTVEKDLVAMFGALHAPASVSVGGDRVVQPGIVLSLPLLVLVLVVLVIIRECRASRRRRLMYGHPYPPRP
jgi:hypothetical protein